MKKVKIIVKAKEKYPFLEEAINEFIKDKNVLDIQYVDGPTFISALIIYDEVPTLDTLKEQINLFNMSNPSSGQKPVEDSYKSAFDDYYNK